MNCGVRFSRFVILVFTFSAVCCAQPDAGKLLREAAEKYRAATSFDLQWETTITTKSPYADGWSKQIYRVAEDGRKFHWENTGSGLRGLRISDGQSDWFYQPGLNQYFIRQADQKNPSPGGARGGAGGTTEDWVKSSMQSLLRLEDDSDDAVMAKDELLTFGTEKVLCSVVRAQRTITYREGLSSTKETTYWIEKHTGLVRKNVMTTLGPASPDDDVTNQKRTVEIVYTTVRLGYPDPKLFQFTAPAGAYLVEDARQGSSRPVAVGTPARALKLKDNDGALFDLAEQKGKPVLVQFWASWCGPCKEEMKALARLQNSHKNIVIVSIDEDEQPSKGDVYFKSQNYGWKNLHDVGEVEKSTWGVTGFPFLALIDSQGVVRWTNEGVAKGTMQTLETQLGGLSTDKGN